MPSKCSGKIKSPISIMFNYRDDLCISFSFCSHMLSEVEWSAVMLLQGHCIRLNVMLILVMIGYLKFLKFLKLCSLTPVLGVGNSDRGELWF